jgi:hypothetical protein
VFSFTPVQFAPLSAAGPQPLNMAAPVFVLDSGLPPAVLAAQAAAFAAQLATAELSSTHRDVEGEVRVGTNARTRNSKSMSLDSILPECRAALDAAAAIGWGHYTFAAAKPTGGQWQALAYEPGGFFVPHYDDSYRHKASLYRNRPDRAMTALLYLTEDYTGGGLRFPRVVDATGAPLVVHPRAGQVVCFPPHARYEHEVLRVESGLRMNISRWYDDTATFAECAPIVPPLAVAMLPPAVYAHTHNFAEDAAGQLAARPVLANLWGAMRLAQCYGHALISAQVIEVADMYSFGRSLHRSINATLVCLGGSGVVDYPGTVQGSAAFKRGAVTQLAADTTWHVRSTGARPLKLLVLTSRRLAETLPEHRPHPDPFSFINGYLK